MLCRTSEFLCNSCFWCTYCNYQGRGWLWFWIHNQKWEEWCRRYSPPMATKLPNPQNCTTATEVEGGNWNWKLAIVKKTKRYWIKKNGMPGCHANETFLAVFWANSTENTNFLIKFPLSNTWSEEHFWSIFSCMRTPASCHLCQKSTMYVVPYS